ncbi:MAG: DUF2780 domain-containing protein [Alphaproteobacteria bacterium]|nr:DUF2780 domain-containing protein [Alphaproteobacteria bacterium]MCB9683416.1 DUF2780 domain-containing protein [Alphaproteobacteria bacterium]
MDLVSALSGAFGIESNQAQAVAGAMLATVQSQAEAHDDGAEVASKLDSAVPEMGGWLDQAKALAGAPSAAPAGGGGMLGGLMGMAGSGAGNQLLGAVAGKQAQNAALLAAVLGKVGLDETKAMMAAPILLQFLESRMDKAWLDRMLAVAPFLTGSQPKAGNPLGGLGGLFG